jgi:hypothetical protein
MDVILSNPNLTEAQRNLLVQARIGAEEQRILNVRWLPFVNLLQESRYDEATSISRP